jgi:hypothetical protein
VHQQLHIQTESKASWVTQEVFVPAPGLVYSFNLFRENHFADFLEVFLLPCVQEEGIYSIIDLPATV